MMLITCRHRVGNPAHPQSRGPSRSFELLARETHEFGVATVMVTHDHDVLEHVDRVLEMVDGRLRPA